MRCYISIPKLVWLKHWSLGMGISVVKLTFEMLVVRGNGIHCRLMNGYSCERIKDFDTENITNRGVGVRTPNLWIHSECFNIYCHKFVNTSSGFFQSHNLIISSINWACNYSSMRGWKSNQSSKWAAGRSQYSHSRWVPQEGTRVHLHWMEEATTSLWE